MAAALPGCAINPLVDVPDRSAEGEVTPMPAALARARQLKEGYHRKACDFVGTQVMLPLQIGDAELAAIAQESKATKRVLPAFSASLANATAATRAPALRT